MKPVLLYKKFTHNVYLSVYDMIVGTFGHTISGHVSSGKVRKRRSAVYVRVSDYE